MYKLHRNYRYTLTRILDTRAYALTSGKVPVTDINKRASEAVNVLITMILDDERTTMEDLHILQRFRAIFNSKWLKSFLGN
jgi:hypothetical protein